jgi:group I intron endonuclease
MSDSIKVKDLTKVPELDFCKTGIYTILNLQNNKFYIGSAAFIGAGASSRKGFYSRWYMHLYNLKLGKHHCRHLQRSWDKAENKTQFEFRILEFVEPEFCIEAEQDYLDLSDKSLLYNVCPVAGSSLGSKRSLASANKKAKSFELVDPKGTILQTKNISKFCRDNGLQAANITDVLAEKQLHHKGYTKTLKHHNFYKKIYEMRGITKRANRECYEVYVNLKFIGGFSSLEEACLARDKAEIEYNFITNPHSPKNWKDLI